MSDIFKINILNSDGISKIYVFYGFNKLHDGTEDVSPEQYFKIEPNSQYFQNIFSSEELQGIASDNISVSFVNLSIRLDDTIEEIKRKIIVALDDTISFDEIYLFAMKKEMFLV